MVTPRKNVKLRSKFALSAPKRVMSHRRARQLRISVYVLLATGLARGGMITQLGTGIALYIEGQQRWWPK
jgi:hypothetical protein